MDWLAIALVIVGGINWGLVGIGNLVEQNINLVEILVGSFPPLASIVYLLVGGSALYMTVRFLEEVSEE